MANRILLLSTSVGAGHLRAAEAVELALRELDPTATVCQLDVLELTNATFRRLYGKAYLDLVRHAPHVLGYLYDYLDRPPSPGARRDRLRRMVERLNLRPFLRRLRAEAWDVVVNTHFLPAEMIARLKRQGEWRTPQFTVTTDFDVHRLWVSQPCERYFTATEDAAAYLAAMGVPAEDVVVSGIPIHPVFSRRKARAACLKRQGLEGKRPVVLQLAGGFGVGPVEQILTSLFEIEVPLEIVVVAGRNEKLQRALERVEPPKRHRAKILGFTDEIDELMAAADIVVSKPGGLTTSEILARGAAMVIVNPIPGQESRNSDFLLENGAAVKINNVAVLAPKVTRLLNDPKRLERLKANARRLARPKAAFVVAREALKWAGGMSNLEDRTPK